MVKRKATRRAEAVKTEVKEEEIESNDQLTAVKKQEENPEGLVPYELERLKLIQRNRERLLALGLPNLVQKLQEIVQPGSTAPKQKRPKAAKKKRVKTEPKDAATGDIKEEDVIEGPGGARRSRRIRDIESRPIKVEETAEAKYERQLGEFIVDGTCPKCHKIYEKGHRAHLLSCGGPRAPSSTKGYSAMDRELLADLTEDEKKDSKKRMLARMKALALSGLVDFTPESAKFIVIGSKGDPYTITLADEKHKCTCLDHRFRRHNCKHICLVLSQVGALEHPETWHDAVEAQMEELIARGEQGDDGDDGMPPVAPAPRDKEAEEAMKFV